MQKCLFVLRCCVFILICKNYLFIKDSNSLLPLYGLISPDYYLPSIHLFDHALPELCVYVQISKYVHTLCAHTLSWRYHWRTHTIIPEKTTVTFFDIYLNRFPSHKMIQYIFMQNRIMPYVLLSDLFLTLDTQIFNRNIS